jgi:hypothetical protein
LGESHNGLDSAQASLRAQTFRHQTASTPVTLQAADYVPGSGIRLDNPFKHGVSAGLLLLDLALSRVPLISYHIQVCQGATVNEYRVLALTPAASYLQRDSTLAVCQGTATHIADDSYFVPQ